MSNRLPPLGEFISLNANPEIVLSDNQAFQLAHARHLPGSTISISVRISGLVTPLSRCGL